MRTIVDLPEEQLAALADWCGRAKISRAEAVRRALDMMLKEKQVTRRDETFGAWTPRGDSLKQVAKFREEWRQ